VDGQGTKAPLARRAPLFLGAAVLLVVWAASAKPILDSLGNRYADGFQFVPFFYASISLLPLGVSALYSAFKGDAKSLAKARRFLLIGGALLALVAMFEVFAWFSDRNPQWGLG
jgi:membrane protease YdiL (CAAX protease family)